MSSESCSVPSPWGHGCSQITLFFKDTHHLLPAALPLIDPFPYPVLVMDTDRAGPRLHFLPGHHVLFLLSSGAAGKPPFIAASPKPSEQEEPGGPTYRFSNLMLSLTSRWINGIIFLIQWRGERRQAGGVLALVWTPPHWFRPRWTTCILGRTVYLRKVIGVLCRRRGWRSGQVPETLKTTTFTD